MNTGSRGADRELRTVLLGLGLVTVVGWGGWVLLFPDHSSQVFFWLLNRPVSVDPDTRTVAYKSAQDRYRINDFAVAQALTDLQVEPKHVNETQGWRMGPDGTWSPAQRTIRVSSFYSLTQCNVAFSRSVTAAGGSIVRAMENSRTRELVLQVGYDTLLTHELTVIRDATIPRQVGHMAIIIDDLDTGKHDVMQQFLDINRPLTFALIPWQAAATRLADEVQQRHQEVIVDLPMEPKSYPRISPGRRAVLLKQSEAENRRIVRDAMAALSFAQGVKNYMGSRATEHKEVMRIVLEEIKRGGSYFIDSRTSSRSIAHALAGQLGVRSTASWGFIDAVDNQERIAMMLDLASYAALERGSIIVIGHARPNTLAVLLQKMDRLELRGIRFVHVSSLVLNKLESQTVNTQ